MALVQFKEPAYARAAERQLHGTMHEELGRLRVELDIGATVHIPFSSADARRLRQPLDNVQRQISRNMPEVRTKYSSHAGTRQSINVISDDARQASQAAMMLKSFLSGRWLRMSRHHVLALVSEDGKTKQREWLEKYPHAVIRVMASKGTGCVQLCGQKDVLDTLEAEMREWCKSAQAVDQMRLPFPKWKQFKAKFKDEHSGVTLSESKAGRSVRLELQGTPEEVEAACQGIRNWLSSERGDSEAKECPICFCDMEKEVYLHPPSDHQACRECATNMLLEAVGSNRIPLKCPACEELLDVATVRELAGAETERVNAAAIRAHLNANLATLAPCYADKCPGLLHDQKDCQFPVCPCCRAEWCLRCQKEAHRGQRCEDQRREEAEAEADRKFREWMQSNGAHTCAVCGAPVQKNKGCNHMTCHCGAHYCNLCHRDFPDASTTYAHFNDHRDKCYGKCFTEEDLLY
eukprot:NODE_610_length_1564_cov_251.352475_g502_i0.p1 GENE.NODE_610_length_1564_cov_251.352475_g502_i0~~NODE_610_length_1564_cov_251.352475_g502_i0.p1  ORF type:complete len:485 (+),score=144.41 NODE_610_length_1564_cov_251.352475_g502_i0:67-1455(+)